MQVPVQTVKEEIKHIKRLHNIDYLTKTKCRDVAGWSWSNRILFMWDAARPSTYTVQFYTPEAETYYRLKWTE